MFERIAKRRPRHGGRGDSECGGWDDRECRVWDDCVMKNVTGSLATFVARDDDANQFTSLCSG